MKVKGSGRSSSETWTSNFSSWSKCMQAMLVSHMHLVHANIQSINSHHRAPNHSLLSPNIQ